MYWILSVGREGVTGLPSSSWVGASIAGWEGVGGAFWGLAEVLLRVPFENLSLMPDFLPGGAGSLAEALVVVVARGGSGSWTVRMCLARASERVKALSHSRCYTVSILISHLPAVVIAYPVKRNSTASPSYGSAYAPSTHTRWDGCSSCAGILPTRTRTSTS